MSETRRYTITFGTVTGEDGFDLPEVAFECVYHDQSYDNLDVEPFTPKHDEYEYMPDPEGEEPGPTWGEVAVHEHEWETYLTDEVLDPIADEMEGLFLAIMEQMKAGVPPRYMRDAVKKLGKAPGLTLG